MQGRHPHGPHITASPPSLPPGPQHQGWSRKANRTTAQAAWCHPRWGTPRAVTRPAQIPGAHWAVLPPAHWLATTSLEGSNKSGSGRRGNGCGVELHRRLLPPAAQPRARGTLSPSANFRVQHPPRRRCWHQRRRPALCAGCTTVCLTRGYRHKWPAALRVAASLSSL